MYSQTKNWGTDIYNMTQTVYKIIAKKNPNIDFVRHNNNSINRLEKVKRLIKMLTPRRSQQIILKEK